jgi:GalNAc-alpha-(1->4)-GalNAc-alpha-(1->3)-diNAcBac-PP-undecaprenol alpha-1,4-N-acetyl-D-galactosaminyltransferase
VKILFLTTNIGYGGASKILVSVANYLCEKGHDVSILTYRDPGVQQPLHANVCHVHRVLYKHPLKPLERFGEIVSLHKYIKAGNFDVALAFLWPSKQILTIASKFTRTKVIIAERGDPFSGSSKHNKGLRIMGIGKIVRTADAFVFQTEGAQSYFPIKVINKSIVIPNPVVNQNIPSQFKGVREKEIVNVARLDIFQKRQDVLIKAFARVQEDHPDYILKLYGDGPDEAQLRKLVSELGVEKKVIFMGVTRNVYEAIRRASVFVLSSDFEGIPNALIEAMSVGMPCISTDCSPGGARLLIKDKENGLLVPINSADKLAQAIGYMLSNPTEAEKMANNALGVLCDYQEDKIYSKWERFIEEV